MIIQVKVIPNAKKELIEKKDNFYLIKVKEKAENNKANERVIGLLADYFKVKPYQIEIIKGQKSRKKIIEIKK
jgi:uncharacterized protein (TIGR00251 family)